MKNMAILLTFIVLAGGIFAESWVIDGNRVYWNSSGYEISATPVTSQSAFSRHIQYVNFSSSNPSAFLTNFSFVFNPQINSGSAHLWANANHPYQIPIYGRVNHTVDVPGVVSYVPVNVSSSSQCYIGDIEPINTLFYNVTYSGGNNTTSNIGCFYDYQDLGGGTFRLFYQSTDVIGQETVDNYYYEWQDISNLFTTTIIGESQVFTINDVLFTQGTNYQVKFDYVTPPQTSGKFDIYAHAGSPAEVVAGTAPIYVELDPWYNTTYTARFPINCTNVDDGVAVVLNGSAGFQINGMQQIVWTNCNSSIYLYYKDNSTYEVGNDTNVLPFEVELGNGTSYNPKSVWSIAGAVGVWHLSESASPFYDSTATGNNITWTVGAEPTQGTGLIGYGTFVNGGSGAGTHKGALLANPSGLPTGSSASTEFVWVNPSGYTDGLNYQQYVGYGTHSALALRALDIVGASNVGAYASYAGELAGNTVIPTGSWTMMGGTYSGTGANGKKYYMNGTHESSATNTFATGTAVLEIGYNSAATQEHAQGYIDEYRIYSSNLSNEVINQTRYNILGTAGYGTLGASEAAGSGFTAPAIVWNNQSPADLTSLNVFGNPMNITFNITGDSNNSTAFIYYKTNSSINDCPIFLNGSAYCGTVNGTYFREQNESPPVGDVWKFQLEDNEVYPATYNFDQELMEYTTKIPYILNTTNELIKWEFLNLSASQYNFLEVNFNSSTNASVPVYYCNSSYSTGLVTSSAFCTVLATVVNPNLYDHNHHGLDNTHKIIPFSINTTTGNIGNTSIKYTPNGYFAIKGQTGRTISVWGITNVSRTNAVRISGNLGLVWSSLSFTVDSHVHQYYGNETLYYWASINGTDGNQSNSTLRYDLIDLAGLPPQGVVFLSPLNQSYANTSVLWINYSAAVSPNQYPIEHYNISLLNAIDETFNLTITNNTSNVSYAWMPTQLGNFKIRVAAYDNFSQSTISISDGFTINSFSTSNGSLAQVGTATKTSPPLWNASFTVTGSGTCNYTIPISGSVNGSVMAAGAQITAFTTNASVIWACNDTAVYGVFLNTENVTEQEQAGVSYAGIGGTVQNRVLIYTQYPNAIAYSFTYSPVLADYGLWLYSCAGTNASCVSGATWSLESFAFGSSTMTKALTLSANETVLIVSWQTSTSGGGGGGSVSVIPISTQGNDSAAPPATQGQPFQLDPLIFLVLLVAAFAVYKIMTKPKRVK